MPPDPASTRLPIRGLGNTEATTFAVDGVDRSATPVVRHGSGTIINGRYRVEKCLGEGGMGVVYEVSDSLKGKRRIALKTIRGDLVKRTRLGQFKTEFRTMTLLRHPNVARVYDFERVHDGEDHFFTMELVRGQNALRATENSGWRDVVDVVVQICRALSYVHSRRLIHYDLKPANVIVDEEGHVKVLDFGIAGRTLIGAPLRGTPQYMAPELTDPETPADHRVDLYSLGVMTYELLCRRVPFQADSLPALLQMHHVAKLTFDGSGRDATPTWLRSVVRTLCAKQPADRYPTANAVIEAINAGAGLAYELETHETRESYILSSRFVGRSAEYTRLNEFISHRVQGLRQSPPVLLVAAQSGTGKSRLLREVRYHAQLSNISFFEGKCFAGSFSELTPLVPVLESLAWLAESRGRPELIERHIHELAKVSPRLGRRHHADPSRPLSDAGKERVRLREHVIDFVLSMAEAAPFVLFVDDLQWGRRGLTELLAQLAVRICIRERLGEPVRMALFGAFREDEVEGRPLEALLRDLKEQAAVEQLDLQPLGLDHVADLLTSMLGVNELPEAFVARVMEETAGNPFFVEELMRTLVEEGVVFLRRGSWSAREDVGDIQIPGTVAAVLRRRVQILDESQRQLLEAMAFCDRPVAVDVLARVTGLDSERLHSALSVLSRRSMALAIPAGDEVRYRVSHDRMRETLIGDVGRESGWASHRRIAAAMHEVYCEQLEDHIFEIADHSNAAAALIIEPDERARAVRLNEEAGRMAKLSGAFDAARRYFEFALDFLPDDAWARDYDRAVDVTMSILEVEYLDQARDRADEHFKLLVTHANTDQERARAYILKVSALTHSGRAYEALAVTQECFPLLGMRMPARPRTPHVLAQLFRTRLALRGKSSQDLLDLPEMEPGTESAAVSLLATASAPAFLTYQEKLGAYHAAKAVQLVATHGNSPGAATMYAMYAFVLGEALGDIAGSHRFAELAHRLAEKYDDPLQLGATTFLLAGFIFPWKYPLSSTVRLHLAGYEASMKAGDLLFASFHLNVAITQQCMCSQSLHATLDMMRKYEELLVRLNNPHTITELTALCQMLKLLGGTAADRLPFDEPGFQEDTFLEYLFEIDDAIPIGFYYTFKLKGLYVMNLRKRASKIVAESERRIPAARGQYVCAEHLFYSFLTRVHECYDQHGTHRRKLLRILDRKLRMMKKWAGQCEENFRHKQLLMEAELAAVRGRSESAARSYADAMSCAAKDGFPFNAALAAELAGRFHMGQGRESEGRDLLRQCRAGYLAWGAGAKVEALDREFPRLDRSERVGRGGPTDEYLGRRRGAH